MVLGLAVRNNVMLRSRNQLWCLWEIVCRNEREQQLSVLIKWMSRLFMKSFEIYWIISPASTERKEKNSNSLGFIHCLSSVVLNLMMHVVVWREQLNVGWKTSPELQVHVSSLKASFSLSLASHFVQIMKFWKCTKQYLRRLCIKAVPSKWHEKDCANAEPRCWRARERKEWKSARGKTGLWIIPERSTKIAFRSSVQTNKRTHTLPAIASLHHATQFMITFSDHVRINNAWKPVWVREVCWFDCCACFPSLARLQLSRLQFLQTFISFSSTNLDCTFTFRF